MELNAELTSVCQSLDQVTLEFFDTLESLYQSQARLEAVMRSGFLSMSRSRYSMGGPRSVGALQFAANEMEMEAVSVVDVSAVDECSEGKDDELSWTNIEISLVEKQADVTKKIDHQKTKHSDDLRQRKGQSENPSKVETIGMKTMADEKDQDNPLSKQPHRLQDPLTLFGVLVSPHLRQCQTSFKQAVAVVVEIANLKNKLQGLQARFQQLITQKNTLVAS